VRKPKKSRGREVDSDEEIIAKKRSISAPVAKKQFESTNWR